MIDEQVELAEVRPPEDVRDRLAADAPPHDSSNRSAASRSIGCSRIGVERRAVDAEHGGEQHLGVEARRVHAGGLELLDRERRASRRNGAVACRPRLCSGGLSFELLPALVGGERIGELVQVAFEHLVEVVGRELDRGGP